MTCVGIDLGNLASKIGVARHRGIDILTNEVSNRATPSLVGFGLKQRSIGEAAKTQEVSNFKNTIGSLKRLIGRSASDPEITEVEQRFVNAKLVDVDGTVGVNVRYLGEPASFTATQLVGMYLAKLRDIASVEVKQSVSDVVIAVPGWYTDVQRRALIDAARIANLNPLRIINDTTAVALGWGITKTDLPEPDQPPRHVVFIDIGHSNYSVAVVAFSKGQLSVKSTAYDRHFGGRDIDYALVQHFAKEFKTKYKIEVNSNAKAIFRLSAQIERIKKILSANNDAILNVESIMNDIDASSKLNREQLEGLIAGLLERVTGPIERALADANLTPDQIDTVEIVGGSTRIPAIRQRIQSVFSDRVISTTLNQDEAIARGATFACAMLSPVFRVREFAFHDISPYSVVISWDPSQDPTGDSERALEVFPRGNAIPSTKILSFARTGAFDLEAVYSDPKSLPGAINPFIAKVHVKNIDAAPIGADGYATVKVRTRLNPHGLLSFEGVYAEEVIEEEQPQQEQPMEVDGQNGEAPAPAPPKKRKVIKKDLPFIAGTTSLDSSILEKYTEQEGKMHAADKLVMETEDRKNALEEYVYDTRSKLEDRYAPFVQPQEKEKILAALQDAEDWLYTEEGEEAVKSAYVAKLDGLRALGDPIMNRWKSSEERPKAAAQLRETINSFLAQAQGNDERYSHIGEQEKQSVVEKAVTIQQWLDDRMVRQQEKPKNVEPVLTAKDIEKKREELIFFATPIMTKLKPKPVVETPPKQEEKKDQPPSGTQTPQEGDKSAPPEMDVD
ncbi:hypothetical protein M422DRAFT_39529 [Sphaerobolus stellatus SS14]|uniref:Heat shock protein 70 n=1 Tax=Sphaerobolus stellatus (strain SS14) TaxID=990650 RepID=A0A0C9TNZ5_SPHS4|nr:hypothetical protein M422DRAFT_39529 [Sphaerobolus stellatus SS14]